MSAVRMPEWQRNVLRMFAHDRDNEFIAEALQVDVEQVASTITELANDDIETAAQLVAAYDKQAELVGASRPSAVTSLAAGPAPTTRPLLASAATRGPSLPPPPKPAPPAQEQPPVDLASFDTPPPEAPVSTSVNRSVLDRAARSDRARTRSLGNKIRGLLDDLAERLQEEDLEREEAALRAAAIRESQRRVEELERELARARDALKEAGGRSHRKPTDPQPAKSLAAAVLEPKGSGNARQVDYDARTVRAWAAENGVECPSRGRFLPRELVEAWRRSTQGAA